MADKKTIGELSVLLGMDTEVFQKKLWGSKNDLQSFGDQARNIAAKFTVAFAAVAGAVKSADKIINATQFTADAWEKNVAGMKQAVDSFFIAVSSGDWTGFINGIEKSITSARNLADELDALQDIRRSQSIQATELEGKQFELLEKLRDRTGKYTIEQQKQYFAEYTKNQEQYNAKVLDAAYRERDAILNNLSAISGLQPIDIYWVLKNYDDFESQFNQVAAKLEKDRNQWAQLHDVSKDGGFYDAVNFDKYLASLSTADRFFVQLYRNYGKLNDAKLDTAVGSINKVGEALNANSRFAVENMRLYNQIFKADKKTPTPDSPLIFPAKGMEGLQFQMPVPAAIQDTVNKISGLHDSVKLTSDKIIENFKNFSAEMNYQFNSFVDNMVVTLAAGFGEAMATGDWDNFGASIIDGFGKFAQQFGALLIAYGTADAALKFSMDPITKIAAGVALVAAGSALSSMAASSKNITSAGGYSGTGVTSSPYENGQNKTYELIWRRAGKDLVAMVKEEVKSVNTLTGKK